MHTHRIIPQKDTRIHFLFQGMFLEIFGPTLKDLKIKTNSSYEDLAGAVSARSIGLFAGCVVGGVLVDRFGPFCHLFLALALDMAAAVTVAAPWSPGINVLTFCCAIGGVSETIINVGKRSTLNLMYNWRSKAGIWPKATCIKRCFFSF